MSEDCVSEESKGLSEYLCNFFFRQINEGFIEGNSFPK